MSVVGEPLRVEDFRGGIADGFLATEMNRSAVLDNVYLDENGKPYTRDGMKVLASRIPTTTGSTRISGIYLGQEPFGNPFVVRGNKLYRIDDTETPNEVTGPTSQNPAFPNKTQSDYESVELWRRQLIVATAPATAPAMRVVNLTTAPTFESYQLGLPALTTPTLSSAGGTGKNYIYGAHWKWVFQDATGTLFEELGPTVEVSVLNVGDPASNTITVSALSSITNTSTTNYDTNTTAVGSIGTTNGTPTLTGFVSTAAILEGSAVSGSNIAAGSKVLSKTSTTVTLDRNATGTGTVTVTFYRLFIVLHRSVTDGSALYEIASIPNGTTSYADSNADSAINTNDVIYTDGDVLDVQAPPLTSRYLTQINDFFWYASDSELTHSNQGAPGHCPAEFIQPVDQKIRGLNRTQTYPILFCDQGVYRVEGFFDELGDGGFELKEVDGNAGCISHRSIVRIPGGLVWAGNGGFWFTDGFQARKISKGLPVRYESWRTQSMVGCFNPQKNVVEWTVSSSTNNGTAPTDIVATLHLDFGLSDYASFTTWGSPNNIYPTALAFSNSLDVPVQWRGKLLVGEARGYFFHQDAKAFTDPIVDVELAPPDFLKRCIRYRYDSAGLDMGDSSIEKYIVDLTASFRTDTEISVQFFSRRDDGGPWASLSELRQDGPIIWGVTEYPWDGPTDFIDHDWNSAETTEGYRHFPAETLRSVRRQVSITNALTWLARSDDLGTCSYTTDNGFKAMQLDDVAALWPDECEEYELCFEDDDYVQGYKIKLRASDSVIQLFDPMGTLPVTAGLRWQMRGYRKNERMHLLSYAIFFASEGQTQRPSYGTEGLVNA